jgi:DNA-binding response OmpR family regulator
MIVDDDPECQNSVKQALELIDKDYTVTCVSSGTQCIELLENNEIPDLILLDIMMPGMSGWETLKIIKENMSWRDIPVAFLTSRSDNVAEITGKFLAADFIKKPFDIEDLKNRVDKILKINNHLSK